jgi:hypothetical protein
MCARHMQDCAKQCLGLVPVKFPAFLKKPIICDFPVIKEVLQRVYFWNPENYKNCWFFDALSIDPSQMLKDETVIWERGRPQPVQERKLSNANIGSLPFEMMYIAGHPDHGVLFWWPFHGAKHGGGAASKEDEGKMYEGCPFWYHGISETLQRHLVKHGHYNKPKGLQKASAEVRARVLAPFDPARGIDGNNFLVCHSC